MTSHTKATLTVKDAKAERAALISPAPSARQVFLLVNGRSVKDLMVSVRKKAFLVRIIAISVVIVEVSRSPKKG